MTKQNNVNQELINELILRLLIKPDDEKFLEVLNKFYESKQLTNFHKLLFNSQIEIQQNFNKKLDLIEKFKKEWIIDENEDDKKEIESEINYQLLYSTHSNYAKLIVNLPFSQKLDIWSIFLEQDLKTNQLCLQLFSTFLLHFDTTSNKIVPLFQAKFNELIDQTNSVLNKIIDLNLIDNSYNLLKWFEFVYSWGQFLFINKIYIKDKSSTINEDNKEFSKLSKFDLSYLHNYKDCKFWKKFLKLSLDKIEKNLEITEIVNKLIIQNILYLNLINIGEVCDELKKLNQESTEFILESIIKYPNLVFYLNLESIYDLSSDQTLIKLFKFISTKYINDNEVKYFKFLSQNQFKYSKKDQTIFIQIFIDLLNEILSSNKILNNDFIELLNQISLKRKEWKEEDCLLSSFNKDSKFWNDLIELSIKLDNLKPITGLQDKKLENLFFIFQNVLELDSLLPGNQNLILIVIIGFLSSYITNLKLSNQILNCFIKILEAKCKFYFLDIYPASSLIKKLFIILAPFNINLILNLINLIVYKTIFKNQKDLKFLKTIFEFFNKLDNRSNKPKYIDNLSFVLRTTFLIQLIKFRNQKKSKSIDNLNNEEFKDLLAHNIERCIIQLDDKLKDNTFNNSFKVNCLHGVFRFFNTNSLNPNMIDKLNLGNYFNLSLKLTFEGLIELKSNSTNSSYFKQILLDYLTFLLTNEIIYSEKLTKLDLIKKIWSILIFQPLDLKDEFLNNMNITNEIEISIVQLKLEENKLKRKLNDNDNDLKVKKLKKDNDQNLINNENIEIQNTIDIDTLLNLTELTLKYCTSDQLNEFLDLLMSNLEDLSSDFVNDTFNYESLKKKVNLFFLIKIVFQNIYAIVVKDKEKINLLKNNVISNLIVQIVDIAQNLYFLKKNVQLNLEDEELKEDELINTKLDDLKNKIDQINNAQIIILQTVESILDNFRPLGNLNTQQLNYLINVCVLVDLTNEQQINSKYFSQLFNCIIAILNRVFIDYEYTAHRAFPSYMNIIENLLQNLCKISFQLRFLSFKKETQEEIINCSINFQHLLLLLSKKKIFTQGTLNIISAYINEEQNDSIYAIIKDRILIGIYKLLNSAQLDNKFQFIHSRLNQDGRQMFKEIYDNYEKFYRFKSYV